MSTDTGRPTGREAEMSVVGLQMALAAAQMGGFGLNRKQLDALALGDLRRKYLGMCGKSDSPWKVYAKLIDAGKVRLKRRRNKCPLLVIVRPK